MLPTIHIVTDLEDTRWLAYLLEEFKRIHRLQAEVKIASIQSNHADYPHKIYYTKDFLAGVVIINKSYAVPNFKLEETASGITVVDQTTTKDERFSCAYDLFWNAFVLLSRYEEYRLAQQGKQIYSRRIFHPRKDKKSFETPWVNIYFNELEKIIRQRFPDTKFGSNSAPIIELSHDVDYLTKSSRFMLKQSVLNAYDLFSILLQGKSVSQSFKSVMKFYAAEPSYWCFPYWEDIEKKFNLRSIFYIYVNARPKNFVSWMIDPSYNVQTSSSLKIRLKDLVREGFEVGVHGSYRSAVNEQFLKEEKDIFENILQKPILKVRQHWLHYDEKITPYIHNKLFKYDSTLGFNDRIGFRSACASCYRPFDHQNQKPFDLYEIPQIIMDFNIFQSLGIEHPQYTEDAFTMLNQLHKFKSVHVAVSWHQQVCNEDYQWHLIYEKMLKEIRRIQDQPQAPADGQFYGKNDDHKTVVS